MRWWLVLLSMGLAFDTWAGGPAHFAEPREAKGPVVKETKAGRVFIYEVNRAPAAVREEVTTELHHEGWVVTPERNGGLLVTRDELRLRYEISGTARRTVVKIVFPRADEIPHK